MVRWKFSLALVLLVLGLAGAFVGRAAADSPLTPPIVGRGVDVVVTPWAEVPFNGAAAPRLNAMATAGDRIFVVEDIGGRIWELVEGPGGREAVLFLDVAAAIDAATDRQMDTTNLFHGGVRGLAFHPDFAVNGRFYTSVMETKPAAPNAADYLSGFGAAVNADGVLVEWQVDAGTGLGDPSSYRQVFRVGIPFYDHPIKQIAFNPFAAPGDPERGLLYVGHGDGSVLSDIAGTGQANDALGKVLRIDPLEAGGAPYTVPADNPFVGDPTMLDEVWSLGHRNPHHLAFVRGAADVLLVVAEPGRDNVEEINVVVAGADYGWSDREGTFVHLDDPGLGIGVGVDDLPANDVVNGYTYPAAQIGHDPALGPQAIAGGYATNNGSELDGQYLSADFPRSGLIWHAAVADLAAAVTTLDAGDPDRDAPGDLTQAVLGEADVFFDADGVGGAAPVAKTNLLDVFDDAATYDGSGRADVRFGQGPDGELYVLNKRNGVIYLVLNSLPVEPPPPVGPLCGGRLVTVDLNEGDEPTDGDDVILGTDGADVINGLGGDDVICGGDGDDVIDGGFGDDRLYGQDGDDVVLGGFGRDRIAGGAGHDDLRGGANRDLIDGNRGRDTIQGDSARDRIQGGSGNDVIEGNGGNDRIKGGGGDDRAMGGRGVDLCIARSRSRVVSAESAVPFAQENFGLLRAARPTTLGGEEIYAYHVQRFRG